MIWIYAGFVAFVLLMLVLDLKVVNRHAREVRAREALAFTGVTVALALAFAGCIWAMYAHDWPAGITRTLAQALEKSGPRTQAQIGPLGLGFEAATTYLTAWILEYALSVDNLFVIAVIFGYFRVPANQQHRVLFWGVLGALVMRGAMIALGTTAVRQFHWLEYVFGAFLVFTAFKMLRTGEEKPDPSKSPAVRTVKRLLPMTSEYHGEKFVVREGGRLVMTPLLLVLVTVEFTDVIFAVDSIPAAIGLTTDPFLVFTSNVFAILGLRSLYFAIAAALDSFRYLKVSLVFVLGFIGVKMLIGDWLEISPLVSLGIVLGILLAGALASVLAGKRERSRRRAPIEDLTGAVEATRKNLKRVFILIAGSAVILVGILIAPLPGPGPTVLVPIGLAILGTEFVWAQRLNRRLKDQTRKLANVADDLAARSNPWLVPPVILFVGAAVVVLAHHGPIVHRFGASAAKYVYMASIGVWIPLLYWSWQTVRKHRRRRSGSGAASTTGSLERGGMPEAAPPPARRIPPAA